MGDADAAKADQLVAGKRVFHVAVERGSCDKGVEVWPGAAAQNSVNFILGTGGISNDAFLFAFFVISTVIPVVTPLPDFSRHVLTSIGANGGWYSVVCGAF